jgi:hypothetical protein
MALDQQNLIPDLDNLIPDPLGRLGLGGGPRKKKLPDLPPAEQKSMVNDVLGKGLGLLQYVGETLDKPGRATRGLLTGNYGELANLIPFSDAMGLTNPEQSVSGRDMLEKWGALGPNEVGVLDRGDVAGLAAEMAFDPTAFLSLGGKALTTAGKAAKAAGVPLKGAARYGRLGASLTGAAPEALDAATHAASKSGTTLGALHGEQMGGLFGLGIPFTGKTWVPEIAKGPKAQAVSEGIGAGLDWLGKTRGGVYAKGMFHYPSAGQFTVEGQMAGKYATEAKRAASAKAAKAVRQTVESMTDLQGAFQEAFGDSLGDVDQTKQMLDAAVQTAKETRAGGLPHVDFSLGQELPGVNVAAPLKDQMQDVTKAMLDKENSIYAQIAEKGGQAAHMVGDDTAPIGHGSRAWDMLGKEMDPKRFQQLRTSFEAATQRVPAIRFIPATTVNRMLRDPEIAHALKNEGPIYDILHTRYRDALQMAAETSTKAAEARVAQMATKVPTKITRDMRQQLLNLGLKRDEIKNLTPQQAWDFIVSANKPDKPVTPEAIANGLEDWLGQHKGEKGGFITDPVANTARYLTNGHLADANLEGVHRMVRDTLAPGGLPLEEGFKQMGLVPEQAANYFTQKFGPVPEGMGVAPEAVRAANNFLTKTSKPEWMQKTLDLIKGPRDFIKRNLTLPFANFAVRNLEGGQVMNALMSGELDSPGAWAAYAKNLNGARAVLKNPAQDKALLDEAFDWGVLQMDMESMGVGLNKTASADSLPNPITGKGFLKNFSDGLKDARQNADDWTGLGSGLPGAKKVATAINLPSQIGGNFNAQVEFLNRYPMYKTLRTHHGYTPEVASRIVRQLQVAYEELTPFEKDVMKNLVPFYSYTRKTVPLMFKQMAEHPGGGTAQLIRASNTGRSDSEFVPGYIGEGMSIPVGENSYLSQLGLPTDQLGELAAFGPTPMGTVKRTLQKLGSQAAPPLKLGVELMTGQNLFSGQPLTDMYQYPTNNVLANAVIGDSPLARYVSTVRSLSDDRKSPGLKALNTLTGVKISTPSGGVERQKQYAAKALLDEMLREDPGIASTTDLYLREGATLTPETERRYQAYRGITKEQRKASKKRKEEQGKK